ncbi:MAG: MBOAT family protein, partial [Sediminibacterium sp.]
MKGKNFILLIFSLLFYAWGEPIWITLLLFSSIVNYFMALFISNHRGSASSKVALMVSICINI